MTAFSFIHASNLLLDSPPRGLATQPPAVAEALRAATLGAFEGLIRLALEKDVAFVIIAGDALDAADRNMRAQIRFRDGLARLAERGIQSFVALGERDPLDGWSSTIEWPQGVHLFSAEHPETLTAERHGKPLARLTGVSFATAGEERPLAEMLKPEGGGLFQIAVIHRPCMGKGCDHEALKRAGFDYWALGHPAALKIISKSPALIAPGNLQGLSAEESGPHGCCLVHVNDNRQASVEFMPVDAVRWMAAEVSIEGIKNAEVLGRMINEKIELLRAQGEGRPVVARLSLVGRGPLYYEFNTVASTQDLLERARKTGTAADPLVWVQAIEPRCEPEIDWERHGRGQDMMGQVLKVGQALRGGEIASSLAPVLAPLFEDGQARRALEALSPAELEAILTDAEHLCLDNLEKSE